MDSGYYPYYFYLLESLATVRSAVLLLELDNWEFLMHACFVNLFDAVKQSHPSILKQYIKEIFEQLLDECELVREIIVVEILERFDNTKDGIKFPAAKEIASAVLVAAASKLEPFVCQVLFYLIFAFIYILCH